MTDQTGAAPLPDRQRSIGPAIVGGIVGSLVTAILLTLVAPRYLSETIVRNGLSSNPQILSDTVDALQDSQYRPVLEAQRAAIETPFASSWRGAAQGDVTLVEFYDYACPYCKSSNGALDRLLAEDKGLKVVFREFPILGPDSATAARLSLQASKIGRFGPFHDTLWAAGKPGAETLAKAAAAAGIPAQPKPDREIEAELKRNYEIAARLGATGTPIFVVGDKVFNGAVGYDALKAAIAEARARKG